MLANTTGVCSASNSSDLSLLPPTATATATATDGGQEETSSPLHGGCSPADRPSMLPKTTGVSRATNNSDFRFLFCGVLLQLLKCDAKAVDILAAELLWAWRLDKACRRLERHLAVVRCILLEADAKSCTNPARWMVDLKTLPTRQTTSLMTSDKSFRAAAQICRPFTTRKVDKKRPRLHSMAVAR